MRVALPVLLLIFSVTACGPAPQPRRPGYVDQMVFAPAAPDESVEQGHQRNRGPRRGSGVDAEAMESPGAPPRRPTTNNRSRGAGQGQGAQCAEPRAGSTRSVGGATAGSLRHGCLLPRKGVGYVRRNRAGWGTEESVAMLQWATAAVAKLYPRSARIVIGALSKRGGGKLRGHRSHQSGRDVDIGYFASDNRALPHFRRMNSGNLDVIKTWSLLGALLSTGQVQYMFMDYELQVLFHRYLEGEGVNARTLQRIFQFPAGRRARRGIIRHAKGHADHVHVRFRCPPHGECR